MIGVTCKETNFVKDTKTFPECMKGMQVAILDIADIIERIADIPDWIRDDMANKDEYFTNK